MTPNLVIAIATLSIAIMAFANDISKKKYLYFVKLLWFKLAVIIAASITIYCATEKNSENSKSELAQRDSLNAIRNNIAMKQNTESITKLFLDSKKENENLYKQTSIALRKEQLKKENESKKLNLVGLKDEMKQSQTLNAQLLQSDTDSLDIRLNYVKEIRQIYNRAITNTILLENDTFITKYNFIINAAENVLQELNLNDHQFSIIRGTRRLPFTSGNVKQVKDGEFYNFNKLVNIATDQTLTYTTKELNKIHSEPDYYPLRPTYGRGPDRQ